MNKHIGRDFIAPGYRLQPYGELRKTLHAGDPLADDFAEPKRQSMKLGKHRNFDGRGVRLQTRALRRWLGKQSGKSWAQVQGDIARLLRRKSEWHMRQWLMGEVERNAYLNAAGEIVFHAVYQGEQPVSSIDFYVDPNTQCLVWNRNRPTWKSAYRERVALAAAEQQQTRRELDPYHVLCKLRGIWYHLTLREIEPADVFASSSWDAAGLSVYAAEGHQRQSLYGDPGLMCVNKRQLSSKEIRQRKLN